MLLSSACHLIDTMQSICEISQAFIYYTVYAEKFLPYNIVKMLINYNIKYILCLLLCLLLLSNAASAQDKSANKIPTSVASAFNLKCPNATQIRWEKEDAKVWEAEFTSEGNKISANFADDGTWLETEREIVVADLPMAVAVAA